jgi:hypothetical protein
LLNITGANNTANGALALLNNTEGDANTATGESALFSNTTGNFNTATGELALYVNTTGNVNTATGNSALFSNVGDANTANGHQALANNTKGNLNTANGYRALLSNTGGAGNTALGYLAGQFLTNGTTISALVMTGLLATPVPFASVEISSAPPISPEFLAKRLPEEPGFSLIQWGSLVPLLLPGCSKTTSSR